jgi:hypothetical protein
MNGTDQISSRDWIDYAQAMIYIIASMDNGAGDTAQCCLQVLDDI